MSFCTKGEGGLGFGLALHDLLLQGALHRLAQRVVDDLKVHRRVLLVEPAERGEGGKDDREAIRAVAVVTRREDGRLLLLLREHRAGHLGDDRRAQHQRLDDAEAKAEIDELGCPACHIGVGGDHEDHRRALVSGVEGGGVHGPRALLARVLLALHLQDDRQDDAALLVAEIEDEIGAELDGEELVERGLADEDGCVGRDGEVEGFRGGAGRARGSGGRARSGRCARASASERGYRARVGRAREEASAGVLLSTSAVPSRGLRPRTGSAPG